MEAIRTVHAVNLTNDIEFRQIFDDYYVPLCMFSNHYVENSAIAADIVQECFLKLWQLRSDFFYLHQVKSFLYTTVRNKSLNELEHSKIVSEYAQKLLEKSSDNFYQEHVIEEDVYQKLSNAINQLPDQMRAIMNLALEEMSNKEIAEQLGISIETVRTLKKIAYRKLRESLKEYSYLVFFLLI